MVPIKKTRIVVFGSFYRGYYVLTELLRGRYHEKFHVVGAATDDVNQNFISAHKRVWQYQHESEEETMFERYASGAGLEVYKGRVKSDQFFEMYSQQWKPEICLSATFGQRIDERVFAYPEFGFLNIHPCIEGAWPSKYAGPNPFKAMKDDGCDHVNAALHRIDNGFDTGELVAMSAPVAMPPHASVVDMHKITSAAFAKFAVEELVRILNEAV